MYTANYKPNGLSINIFDDMKRYIVQWASCPNFLRIIRIFYFLLLLMLLLVESTGSIYGNRKIQ